MPERDELLDQLPWAQWRPEGDRTDNQEDIEKLLAWHHARCKRDGDRLLVQAWGGMNVRLETGDCLVLDGDRVGIVRASPTQH
jgi:hypothetical protein